MVTTNDEELYKKLCLYRTHGITKDVALLHENHGGWYYEMQELGFNYRMTDFQAALGVSQLSRANTGLSRRQEIANRYDEAFQDIQGIKIPYRAGNVYHAFHLYVIQVEDCIIICERIKYWHKCITCRFICNLITGSWVTSRGIVLWLKNTINIV